jgi:hypothetical protein
MAGVLVGALAMVLADPAAMATTASPRTNKASPWKGLLRKIKVI